MITSKIAEHFCSFYGFGYILTLARHGWCSLPIKGKLPLALVDVTCPPEKEGHQQEMGLLVRRPTKALDAFSCFYFALVGVITNKQSLY